MFENNSSDEETDDDEGSQLLLFVTQVFDWKSTKNFRASLCLKIRII